MQQRRLHGGEREPIQLYHTAFVSSTSITALVPQNTPTGAYTALVVNPDGCAEPGPTLDVVATPPPIVDNVSPGVGAARCCCRPARSRVRRRTNGAILLLGGGPGLGSTGNTVEYAVVGGGTGGMVATAWASPGGFSVQRDGSQLQVQNGYTPTADLATSTTLTATGGGTLQYGSWSSSTLQLSSKIGRMGVANDSAYFFVIGGTSNDTDALATVYQILD